LSEQATYSRITAARTVRRFPQILALLADGALSLSSVGLLAPHLTDETVDAMLEAAAFKSTRDVECLIAAWHPQPDVPTTLRALPGGRRKTGESSAGLAFDGPATRLGVAECGEWQVAESAAQASVVQRPTQPPPASRTTLEPIAPRRYLLKLTIGQDSHDKLQRLRALLRHSIPDGDTEKILNRALGSLLDQVERPKCAKASKPRCAPPASGRGRYIPAGVRREVWRRDGGRCVFVGADGCCGETAFLEYHHVVPFAIGGRTDADNLQLRCRAHNAYEAVAHLGAADFALRA